MPPDVLRYTPPQDALAVSRAFLRSASPLRSWLLPNLRLMDHKIGRPMVGGASFGGYDGDLPARVDPKWRRWSYPYAA